VYYNELLASLFKGIAVPQETVQYCRHPGNSYDRQYAKFCRPFAEAGPPPAADRLRLRLCEAITQDRAERLAGHLVGSARSADGGALRLAQQRHQAGDFAGAEAACRRLLETGPADAEVWYLLGSCRAAQGQGPEAEAAYREAMRLRPDHAPALLALASLLTATGRRAEAVHYYRRAVHARPDDAEARTQLGVALAEQGELDEATAHLRTACRQAPAFAKAPYNLGVALAQLMSSAATSATCFNRSMATRCRRRGRCKRLLLHRFPPRALRQAMTRRA
jgi:Flp pilus assembly protein TadD